MKKSVLTFVFLLLGILAFVSCKKDNPEDGVSVRPDELAYLQGHFASVDGEGELTIMAGWQLNEADPGELSMKADSFEAAAAIFKKIILPEANVEETENSLIWHLTGKDGQSQGDAILSKASGDKVAVLTMPASATLVNRVNFIPHSLWPENGEYEYREELDDFYLFNMVKVEVNLDANPGSIYCKGEHGTGDFLVIKEYDQETNTFGIIIRLPQERRYYDKWHEDEDNPRAPSTAVFDEVRKCYLENKEILDKLFDEIGFTSRLSFFLVNDNVYYVRLDDRKWRYQSPYHECLVYRFGLSLRPGTPSITWHGTFDMCLVLK